jgi:hypothetical protein
MADGGVFDLYANGVHLARVEDDTYVAAGRFGFFVHPFSAQGFSIAYRDLEVWLGEGEGALEIAPTPDGSASDEDEVLVMATTDTVNVRSGPGNEYPSLGKAPEGTLVKVIGYSGDGRWAYVSLPPGVASGGIGWVNAAYLELVYEDGN